MRLHLSFVTLLLPLVLGVKESPGEELQSNETPLTTLKDEDLEGLPTDDTQNVMVKRSIREIAARRRSALDKNFMRFGRSDPSMNEARVKLSGGNLMRFGRNTNRDFMRFGRSPGNLMRFGRSPGNLMRFGRSPGNLMRFGRTPGNLMRFGRGGNNLMRFGRSSNNLMRFGRGGNNLMRFGRGGNNLMRFGRSGNLMRFGRANNNLMRFGRANNNLMRFGRGGNNLMRFGRNDEDFLNYDNDLGSLEDEETDDDTETTPASISLEDYERVERSLDQSSPKPDDDKFGEDLKRSERSASDVGDENKENISQGSSEDKHRLKRSMDLREPDVFGILNDRDDNFIRFGRSANKIDENSADEVQEIIDQNINDMFENNGKLSGIQKSKMNINDNIMRMGREIPDEQDYLDAMFPNYRKKRSLLTKAAEKPESSTDAKVETDHPDVSSVRHTKPEGSTHCTS